MAVLPKPGHDECAEIHDLLSRHCWAFDGDEMEALRELFTADAQLNSSEEYFTGRDAFLGNKERLLRTPAFRGRKYQYDNLVIQHTAQGLHGRAYRTVTNFGPETGEKRTDGMGHYVDEYVRADGCWRFSNRLFRRW